MGLSASKSEESRRAPTSSCLKEALSALNASSGTRRACHQLNEVRSFRNHAGSTVGGPIIQWRYRTCVFLLQEAVVVAVVATSVLRPGGSMQMEHAPSSSSLRILFALETMQGPQLEDQLFNASQSAHPRTASCTQFDGQIPHRNHEFGMQLRGRSSSKAELLRAGRNCSVSAPATKASVTAASSSGPRAHAAIIPLAWNNISKVLK